jgi:hypothetical protein
MKVPELTFSEEVACFVAREYAAARVILEYGSGGSTHLASQLAGKRVFSVESDCHDRQHYSVVEKYAPIETKVGRMAVFTVPPGTISAADLATNVAYFFDPR